MPERRILVVSEFELIGAAIVALLQSQPKSEGSIELVDHSQVMHEIQKRKPAVVLLVMPASHVESLQLIRQWTRLAKVIVIMPRSDGDHMFVQNMIRAGIQGILTQERDSRSLQECIDVALGKRVSIPDSFKADLCAVLQSSPR
jgi:DNA-binding NarL/FixJ family response regulator